MTLAECASLVCIDTALDPAVFRQRAAGGNQARRSDGGIPAHEFREIRTVPGGRRLSGLGNQSKRQDRRPA